LTLSTVNNRLNRWSEDTSQIANQCTELAKQDIARKFSLISNCSHPYKNARAAARPPTKLTPAPAPFWIPAFLVAAAEVEPLAAAEETEATPEEAEPVADVEAVEAPVAPDVKDAPADDEAAEAAEEVEEAPAAELLPDWQTTWSGTATPWVVQICLAYATAAVWSAALHAEARQQAMLLRKLVLLHMHLASMAPHVPMLLPDVNFVTQAC
jgi:hypothetical protein